MCQSLARLLLISALLAGPVALAQEATPGTAGGEEPAAPTPEAPDRARPTVLDTVTVVGSSQAADDLPGSGAYLVRSHITTQGYEDIHRVLRQVAGVYVREEDGYGLFPNISLRGVDPGRSAKLTLMEDGVLTAPAPYSDPSAYYAPNVARMQGLEILKGSSQVRFGPHATGGVINYLSTPIPEAQSGYTRTAFGSDNDLRTHSGFGTTETLAGGHLGWLVEAYYRESDGFKQLDGPFSAVSPDAGETGFRRVEPMLKLAWEPNTGIYQRFEFKYGTSDLDARETYLGLSEADFGAEPYRRYAASRFDNIQTEHGRVYLRHFAQVGTATELTTTLYRNEFHRNWFKINAVDSGTGSTALSRALAGSNAGADLAVLRGEAAGSLFYRNNNREYFLRGAEVLLRQRLTSGSVGHTLGAGLRLHEDEIFRFQNDETYTQDGSGSITGHTIGAPGSQDNRRLQTRALALYLEDRIRVGNFSVIPGARVEQLDWRFSNYNSAVAREGDRTLYAGGVGVNWDATRVATLFGGVYQGFSPPNPENGTNPANPQEEETSLSVELGTRLRGPDTLVAELAVFATRFENLVVSGNLGASGTADGGAVGEVDSRGMELALRYNPGAAAGWKVSTPLALAATWTRAVIGNDSNSTDAESIFNGGSEGNRLPYIPDWQATLDAGLHAGRWRLDAALIYVDQAYATALNTDTQVIQAGAGLVADARGGTIDSFFTVDLRAGYLLNERIKLFVNAHNLFDEEYVASRLPEGPRPGTPLTVLGGMEIRL
jgi:Fe(3+) dicitrate transport protein